MEQSKKIPDPPQPLSDNKGKDDSQGETKEMFPDFSIALIAANMATNTPWLPPPEPERQQPHPEHGEAIKIDCNWKTREVTLTYESGATATGAPGTPIVRFLRPLSGFPLLIEW